jgi:hypothetical protein
MEDSLYRNGSLKGNKKQTVTPQERNKRSFTFKEGSSKKPFNLISGQ